MLMARSDPWRKHITQMHTSLKTQDQEIIICKVIVIVLCAVLCVSKNSVI